MSRLLRTLVGLFNVRQWKRWLSAYVVHRERSLPDAIGVRRRMRLRGLPFRPGGTEVWAVSVVRNEADIIAASIGHLLDQGVDGVLVCDHLSTDGTSEILASLARSDRRIHLTRDSHPGHVQAERVTRLAQRVWWAGAGWVVPFDADEFWYARDTSLTTMLRATRASIVRAEVHDLVPAGDADGVDLRLREYRVDAVKSLTKVAFRANPLVMVGPGNHGVNLGGDTTGGAMIAHLPYRSPEQMARKFRVGSEALDASGDGGDIGWHWRAGSALSIASIEDAWRSVAAGAPVPSIGWEPGMFGAAGPWLTKPIWPIDEPSRA